MEPLGPEVKRELRRFGPAADMADLVAAWPAAVGTAIAQNAWPARFTRDGTLVVHTADAVWAFELGQRAPEIRARMSPLVPNGIKFVPGPLPAGSGAASPQPPPLPDPTPEQERQAAAWAAAVDDPELRELVARAASASLARAGSDRGF